MVLYKLKEFDSNYQNALGSDDFKGLDVYADTDDEKVVVALKYPSWWSKAVSDCRHGFLGFGKQKYCYQ